MPDVLQYVTGDVRTRDKSAKRTRKNNAAKTQQQRQAVRQYQMYVDQQQQQVQQQTQSPHPASGSGQYPNFSERSDDANRSGSPLPVGSTSGDKPESVATPISDNGGAGSHIGDGDDDVMVTEVSDSPRVATASGSPPIPASTLASAEATTTVSPISSPVTITLAPVAVPDSTVDRTATPEALASRPSEPTEPESTTVTHEVVQHEGEDESANLLTLMQQVGEYLDNETAAAEEAAAAQNGFEDEVGTGTSTPKEGRQSK